MSNSVALRDSTFVSEFLGVPVATLDQWAYQGKGPRFFRVGRHRRYDETELRAWLEAQASRKSVA